MIGSPSYLPSSLQPSEPRVWGSQPLGPVPTAALWLGRSEHLRGTWLLFCPPYCLHHDMKWQWRRKTLRSSFSGEDAFGGWVMVHGFFFPVAALWRRHFAKWRFDSEKKCLYIFHKNYTSVYSHQKGLFPSYSFFIERVNENRLSHSVTEALWS